MYIGVCVYFVSSTVAACLSAMASVTWEDFFKWKFNYLSDKKQTFILKLLGIYQL